MTDIAAGLKPETLARQLGNPEGEIGLAVANRLNSINAEVHARAYQAMGVADNNRIFEVGFGNGHLIPELISLAKGVKYAGLDTSETMVNEASAFNAALIAEGRVEIKLGSSALIPFANAVFDRALALNTIYFWNNPFADLAEIRRVLQPGGKLVLGSVAPSSTRTNPIFKHGFRFYEREEILAMLGTIGFSQVGVKVFEEIRKRPDGVEYASDYFIVSAT